MIIKEISHLLRRIQVVGLHIEDRIDLNDLLDVKTQAHVIECLKAAVGEMRKARDPIAQVDDARFTH